MKVVIEVELLILLKLETTLTFHHLQMQIQDDVKLRSPLTQIRNDGNLSILRKHKMTMS